jgi:aconitate hydratase 2
VLEAYRSHLAERAAEALPGLALNVEQTAGLVELLKNPPAGEEAVLLDLITNRVPPGVDEATYVKAVLQSWSDGEWFTKRPAIAEKYSLTVFKVPGETNIDDLSPAPDAWSRPDIPLHALAMLKMARDGIVPEQQGAIGPLKQIEEVKAKGFPVAYVGDVVGTGSSRKSATNSVLWFFGDDIPYVPNKRAGGFCFGSMIAPIFYNTMEDAGALPIEFDVSNLEMGDVIDVYPYAGKVCKHGTDDVITSFELKTPVLLDEVRAGGRIPLIVGRGLTDKARTELGLGSSDLFKKPEQPADSGKGFTLAHKMVGKACGVTGLGGIAEHGAAVELLAVARQGGGGSHQWSSIRRWAVVGSTGSEQAGGRLSNEAQARSIARATP